MAGAAAALSGRLLKIWRVDNRIRHPELILPLEDLLL
jgi:hypothetical protein